jgi:hypothetical protein
MDPNVDLKADVLQSVTLAYQLDFAAFLGDHVEAVISKPYVPLLLLMYTFL